MGKKAKPIDLLLIEGKKHLTKKEIEERKAREQAIKPRAEKITVPNWLCEIATEEFNRQVDLLKEVELITEADIMQLATYCDAYANYIKCTEIINQEGFMIKHTNKSGETNKVSHPLLTKKKQLFEQMKAMAIEFGLTPSSRAKIALPKQEEKEPNEFERLFGDL